MKYTLRFPFLARDTPPPAAAPLQQQFVDQMNALREGFAPFLALDGPLSAVAWTRAMASADMGLPLTHRDANGNMYISALVPLPYQWLGETLYMTTRQNTNLAEETVAAWKGSPRHLDEMVFGLYTEVGVGVYRDSSGASWVAAVFRAP